jgi:hypothetical protein
MSGVQLELDQTSWEPGEVLRGRVIFDPDQARAEVVEVVICWRTEGKGDEDREVCGRWFHRPGQNENAVPFTVQLPMLPLSYEGVIVKIRWYAEVRTRQDGVELTGLLKLLERILPGTEHRVAFQLGHVRAPEELQE